MKELQILFIIHHDDFCMMKCGKLDKVKISLIFKNQPILSIDISSIGFNSCVVYLFDKGN